MKVLLILFVVFFVSEIYAQYYPVPKTEVNMSEHVNRGKTKPFEVPEFSISELVTVSEFKQYLLAVERDSSKTFYENQLPKLSKKPMELLTALLNDPKLANQPMPGVSWIVARNYCRWLTENAKKNEWQFSYELASIEELVAFESTYGRPASPLLESWTLNSYDESMYEFSHDNGRSYFYDALPNDPPAMKRKMIYGGSYHMNFTGRNLTYPMAQYEYQDSSSAFIGFRVVRKVNSDLSKSIMKQIQDVSVQVGSLNNHLNGIYVESYANGNKKVLGEFQDGQRMGIWSVWDSIGNLKVQREYSGDRNVEYLFPVIENPYAELYQKFMPTDLVRNADGYYPYKFVEERAVVYSNRVHRLLNPSNEPELFRQVDLKKLMISILMNNEKLFEYGNYGQFQVQVPKEKYPELLKELDTWDFSRITIKEDFFFSSDLLKSEVRQLGMNFYTNSTDSLPKYSIYIPQVRERMATFPVQLKGKPEVKNLDDYFFFNYYRGSIISGTNVFDLEIKKDTRTDWEFELEPLVSEHNVWLQYQR